MARLSSLLRAKTSCESERPFPGYVSVSIGSPRERTQSGEFRLAHRFNRMVCTFYMIAMIVTSFR